jgi:hypothetical protein
MTLLGGKPDAKGFNDDRFLLSVVAEMASHLITLHRERHSSLLFV